jgi:CheY-like chemotaxis protein
MLGFVLEKSGHQVSFATNGQEGLVAAHALQPDLIISDLEMPVMDGIAFVQALRADDVSRAIPVIVLTASGEAKHHQAIAQLGINGFATKPVRSGEVIELVTGILAHTAS